MLELSPNQIPEDLKKYFRPKRKYGAWIMRNLCIWHKPNCMPSSVKDRFTVDFEQVQFFVKNKKYWFETQFEPIKEKSHERYKYDFKTEGRSWDKDPNSLYGKMGSMKVNSQGRNKRCVWTINTKPFKGSHFAVFPEALVETPIKAGCPNGGIVLDPFMGSGTVGVVAEKLGRQFIGIELNPDYVKMAEKRINNEKRLF